MAITKNDIINAAEALERDGEKVTMETVRQFLSGGSFATISPVLREWKENRKISSAIVIDIPVELKKAAERMEYEFWKVASGLANERITTVQAKADAKVEEAQAERDETLKEIDRLETELKNLTGQLLTKDEKIAELEKAFSVSKTQTKQALANIENLAENNKKQAEKINHQSSIIQEITTENALMKQLVETTKAAEAEVRAQNKREIKDLIDNHNDTLTTLKEATDKASIDLKEAHAKIVFMLEQQRDEAKKEIDKLKNTKTSKQRARPDH